MEEYKENEILTNEQIEEISADYIYRETCSFGYSDIVYGQDVKELSRDIEKAIIEKLKTNGYRIVKG